MVNCNEHARIVFNTQTLLNFLVSVEIIIVFNNK